MVEKLITRRTEHILGHRGAPYLLSPTDEMLLFLLFLRHHLADCLLAVMFDVSYQTVWNVRKRVTEYMFNEYRHLITLKDAEWRKENGISIFGQKFTWVADGSEQPVLAPRTNSLGLNTYFFSTKKGKSTINILIIINIQTKKVLYLSCSVGGSINDNELVRKTKEEWHSKFNEDEHGLGDLGFTGLEDADVRIVTPVGERHDPMNKVISSYRIRVENVIADLKNWHALDYQLRMKTKNKEKVLAFHNQLWHIAAAFVNEARDDYPSFK